MVNEMFTASASELNFAGSARLRGRAMKTGNTGGWPRRRDLFELCAAAFLASGAAGAEPLAAGAQQPAKVPRVGWIWLGGRSAGNSTEVTGFSAGAEGARLHRGPEHRRRGVQLSLMRASVVYPITISKRAIVYNRKKSC